MTNEQIAKELIEIRNDLLWIPTMLRKQDMADKAKEVRWNVEELIEKLGYKLIEKKAEKGATIGNLP